MRAADSFRINPYKPEQRMPGLNHISDQMLRDNGSNFSDQRSIDKLGHGEQPALAERAARYPYCLLATARRQSFAQAGAWKSRLVLAPDLNSDGFTTEVRG